MPKYDMMMDVCLGYLCLAYLCFIFKRQFDVVLRICVSSPEYLDAIALS